MSRQTKFLFSVLLVVSLACGSVVVAQKKKPRIKYYQIRANQTFHVRLGETLSSKSARVGDTEFGVILNRAISLPAYRPT